MNPPIYLDNNATTVIIPEARSACNIDFSNTPYNPSSIHFFGRQAHNLLTRARENIANFFDCSSEEIIFTSGGTESISLLIKGLYPNKGTILSTDLEHSCIYETLCHMQNQGTNVTFISPGLYGAPTYENVTAAVEKDPNISLIVLSAVYSETGVRCSFEKIAAFAKMQNIPLIVDGVAILGKESFTIPEGVTGMAFSSHKVHGPKGVGIMYLESSAPFNTTILGGRQEFGKRSGTENLCGILGFSAAISALKTSLSDGPKRMKTLRDLFEATLKERIPSIHINGKGPRVCNTSNICFQDIEGEILLFALDRKKIAASFGSACSSGSLEPSRVLLKMGLSSQMASSSLRFSLSRFTTSDEILAVVETICEIYKQQKAFEISLSS